MNTATPLKIALAFTIVALAFAAIASNGLSVEAITETLSDPVAIFEDRGTMLENFRASIDSSISKILSDAFSPLEESISQIDFSY